MAMDWLNRTHIGDCRELLARMAAEDVRVQTCVTSPPYFGLRDYGTAEWEGGDAECKHVNGSLASDKSTLNGGRGVGSGEKLKQTGMPFREVCHCGARRIDRQIGLEPTPAAYVAELVAVFRLVRDVLADDGTLWLNLGDSYASATKGSGGETEKQVTNGGSFYEPRRFNHGLKDKDLMGIPWRVAFALQADGWYLRSDIIWAKPNPMPESVTDRPTKSHEYLFLLSKQATYYYDAASIREEAEYGRRPMPANSWDHCKVIPDRVAGRTGGPEDDPSAGRNRRSVWTIATQPFSGAHFATFPRALIEPCIIAGSPPGGIVLDPFHGSGTTGQVATDLGRQFVGCELNAEYVQLENENRKTTIGMEF